MNEADTKLQAAKLLARARLFNENLVWQIEHGMGLGPWMEKHTMELAEEVYAAEPHWHWYNGKCLEEPPFELYMQCLTLLTCTWVADIFLRKARDRQLPEMTVGFKQWANLLYAALEYTSHDVSNSHDPEAARLWLREGRRPNRLKHWWNKLFWGH